MRLPSIAVEFLQRWAMSVSKRDPDVVIGEDYLLRWHVIPRNRFFNIYLHLFIGSDDPRALHDHPWWNVSCLIAGSYYEHTIAEGGIHKKTIYSAGDLKFRRGKSAHRVELINDKPCWSLFITGPRYRSWGFHCPLTGWVHWKKFTTPTADGNKIGAGCGEAI